MGVFALVLLNVNSVMNVRAHQKFPRNEASRSAIHLIDKVIKLDIWPSEQRGGVCELEDIMTQHLYGLPSIEISGVA